MPLFWKLIKFVTDRSRLTLPYTWWDAWKPFSRWFSPNQNPGTPVPPLKSFCNSLHLSKYTSSSCLHFIYYLKASSPISSRLSSTLKHAFRWLIVSRFSGWKEFLILYLKFLLTFFKCTVMHRDPETSRAEKIKILFMEFNTLIP